MTTPQASDWNRFWDLDKTERFTKISWSKKRILRILRPYMLSGHSALDAGCGSGFFSRCFVDAGMQTTSLDYSEEALEIAKKMTLEKARLFQDDLLQPGLSERLGQKFDLIFTDGLFEHFEKETQDVILKNFIDVLSDRGVIITFVPNKYSPWELIRPFYMPGIEEKPFVLKELNSLNERNDLRVIAQGGVNTFPFAFSPDGVFGSIFGMLLYTVAVRK